MSTRILKIKKYQKKRYLLRHLKVQNYIKYKKKIKKIYGVNELEKGEIDAAIEYITKANAISIKMKKQYTNKVIVRRSIIK